MESSTESPAYSGTASAASPASQKSGSMWHSLGAALLVMLCNQNPYVENPNASGSYASRTIAAAQLERDGITGERRNAYLPGVSELLYRGITPLGYRTPGDVVRTIPENIIYGRTSKDTPLFIGGVEARVGDHRPYQSPEREDAWRLYLGLPQLRNTFGISDFKPSKGKDDMYYR